MNTKIAESNAAHVSTGTAIRKNSEKNSTRRSGVDRTTDLDSAEKGVELTLSKQGKELAQRTEQGQLAKTGLDEEAGQLAKTGPDEEAEQVQTEEQRLEERQEKALKEMFQEQAERAKEAGKAVDDTAKLMEVARRIAHGDKVPFKDEKKLMEFNPKLYQAAKSAAMLRTSGKHKKYKSLFEEEEKDMRERLRELNQESGNENGKVQEEEPAKEGGDFTGTATADGVGIDNSPAGSAEVMDVTGE